MGKVNWTKEQKDAIFEKGANILVAAAAGSGKTAVLVERIINKIIKDKIDIDKLLVVTFFDITPPFFEFHFYFKKKFKKTFR